LLYYYPHIYHVQVNKGDYMLTLGHALAFCRRRVLLPFPSISLRVSPTYT